MELQRTGPPGYPDMVALRRRKRGGRERSEEWRRKKKEKLAGITAWMILPSSREEKVVDGEGHGRQFGRGAHINLLFVFFALFSILFVCFFFLPFDILLSLGSTAVCFMYVSLQVVLAIACCNSPSFVLYL